MGVNEEVKLLWKFKKKNRGGGGVGRIRLGGGGVQGGCEKKSGGDQVRSGNRGSSRGGGCERRGEVIVKMGK